MTPDEFKILFESVKLRLPGVAKWIGAQPTSPGGDPTQTEILQLWRDKLRYVGMEDAVAAVDAIYDNERLEPKSWIRFPVVIRRIAQKRAGERGDDRPDGTPKPKFVDGEQVFECLLCQDDGRAIVLHRKAQEDFLDNPASFDYLLDESRLAGLCTCALACRCRLGDRYARQGMRRLDDSWCLADQSNGAIHAWLTKCREWWLERNQTQQNLSF